MWLPETAVDIETLEVLADLGIQYTILSQRQAKRVKKIGDTENWVDATEEKIDPAMTYLCRLPSESLSTSFSIMVRLHRKYLLGNC